MKQKSQNTKEILYTEPIIQVQNENEPGFEYIIFIVEGGIGKNIMATVPLKGIKLKYPDKKIIVVASWPDVFRFNSDTWRVYQLGNTPFLYDDFISQGKSMVLKAEPYYHNDYITFSPRSKHLTELWCQMLNVDLPITKHQPLMYFTQQELEFGEKFVKSKSKPVMLIQWQGGANDPSGMVQGQTIRSLPQKTVLELSKKYSDKYHLISVQNKEQYRIPGIEITDMGIRAVWSLIPYVKFIVSIDSMLQHISAAFGKPALVCWAGTNPELLGYTNHINLRMRACSTPECHRPNTYLFDIDSTHRVWHCPHGEPCRMHTVDSISSYVSKLEGLVKV